MQITIIGLVSPGLSQIIREIAVDNFTIPISKHGFHIKPPLSIHYGTLQHFRDIL
jgi:hypothetical protein